MFTVKILRLNCDSLLLPVLPNDKLPVKDSICHHSSRRHYLTNIENLKRGVEEKETSP